MEAGAIVSTCRASWAGARYLKEVDVQETTLRFWQEIYDDQGKLVEIHENTQWIKATRNCRMAR